MSNAERVELLTKFENDKLLYLNKENNIWIVALFIIVIIVEFDMWFT